MFPCNALEEISERGINKLVQVFSNLPNKPCLWLESRCSLIIFIDAIIQGFCEFL